MPVNDNSINVAAPSSANPMPICTWRRFRPATMPAPSHAPATAAPMMAISVTNSTSTIVM